MDRYHIYKPRLYDGGMEYLGGTHNCGTFDFAQESTYVDDPYLATYPFLADFALRITITAGYVYTIVHDDTVEVIRMPWMAVEEYLSRQTAELPGWCAMYDCLIQRSKILQSYYPDKSIDNV